MPKHAAATSGAAIAHHFSENREEGAKLEEVAEATGLSDAGHFGRMFRQLTGTPPATWRRDRHR